MFLLKIVREALTVNIQSLFKFVLFCSFFCSGGRPEADCSIGQSLTHRRHRGHHSGVSAWVPAHPTHTNAQGLLLCPARPRWLWQHKGNCNAQASAARNKGHQQYNPNPNFQREVLNMTTRKASGLVNIHVLECT